MFKKLFVLAMVSLTLCGCSKQETADMAKMMLDAGSVQPSSYATAAAGQQSTQSMNAQTPDESIQGFSVAAEDVGGTGTLMFFYRSENSHTDEKGRELLDERLDQPQFYCIDDEDQKFVNHVLSDTTSRFYSDSAKLLESAKKASGAMGDSPFYSYTNYRSTGVARHDERVISILSLSNVYSGGTSAVSLQTSMNLDLEQHKILTFEDVVNPEKTTKLVRMVGQRIYEKFKAVNGFKSAQDVIDIFYQSFEYGKMTPYWYFNHNGVVVFFNQYELGLETSGIVQIELSYKELEGILLPEFFPTEYKNRNGQFKVTTKADGCRQIPVVVESGGSNLLIAVEGRVDQVQISEVFWLEGTAINKRMLFSASHLESTDVLQIVGGFDDPDRSFVIEYINSTGQVEVRYIHADQLTKKP